MVTYQDLLEYHYFLIEAAKCSALEVWYMDAIFDDVDSCLFQLNSITQDRDPPYTEQEKDALAQNFHDGDFYLNRVKEYLPDVPNFQGYIYKREMGKKLDLLLHLIDNEH